MTQLANSKLTLLCWFSKFIIYPWREQMSFTYCWRMLFLHKLSKRKTQTRKKKKTLKSFIPWSPHRSESLKYTTNHTSTKLSDTTSHNCLADKHPKPMQLTDKFHCQWDRTHSLQSFTILPIKQTEALARWHPRLRSLVWNVSWGLLLQLSAARLVHTILEQLPFFCCKQSTGSYLHWPLPCLHYYIFHPSCVEKTRGERDTNEEQTVNSHDASEGAKREWGSHQYRLDLALVVQSLSCRGEGGRQGAWWTAFITPDGQLQPKLITWLAGSVLVVDRRSTLAQFPICSSFSR